MVVAGNKSPSVSLYFNFSQCASVLPPLSSYLSPSSRSSVSLSRLILIPSYPTGQCSFCLRRFLGVAYSFPLTFFIPPIAPLRIGNPQEFTRTSEEATWSVQSTAASETAGYICTYYSQRCAHDFWTISFIFALFFFLFIYFCSFSLLRCRGWRLPRQPWLGHCYASNARTPHNFNLAFFELFLFLGRRFLRCLFLLSPLLCTE